MSMQPSRVNSQETLDEPPATPVVLVTGVGRAEGIGFELCRQLAARGMTVLLTARDLGKAQTLADKLVAEGFNVQPYGLDVSSEEMVKGLAAHVAATYGRLDILVNNAAGVSTFGEQPSATDLEAAHQAVEVTLFGAWRVCQAFLPLLHKSRSGRIVNVSSGAGSHGDPQFGLTTANGMGPAYAVSKAALNALTAAFAQEQGSGLLVNAVCPGFTATFPGAEAMGARPVSEAATGIVWAAMLPDNGPTGGFFRDGKPLPW